MRKFSFLVLSLIVALSACTGNSTSNEEHAHDENLQLTAYSNDFEVFAEATPFVLGQQSEILAHFSFLKNFKPLTEGSVTASLIVGTDGVRQTLAQPVRPGIYKFTLQPETNGNGKLVFDIKTAEGTSQVVVSNISVFDNEHDAQHRASELAVNSSSGASFTKEQSWKVDFSTEAVRLSPIGQVIRATGQIQPSQGDERIVASKTGGIVLFSADDIVEGKFVRARQGLFTIDASGMADNNLSVRHAEAQNEYNRAKAEYDRKAELAKDNIVSQSDLMTAKTELANAEANFNNLRKNFSSGRQSITSPISGFVTSVLVSNGQYAEAGQPVLVVSQNKDLYIKAEVQTKYYELLGSITTANFRMLNNTTYSLEELNGRVLSFGKTTNLANPLIPVIFQVENQAGLLPGSFVDIYISSRPNRESLTVPNEAIVEEMGNYFVYVQLTPEFFEKRLVKKGVTDGKRTEILEGISDQERVVGKGAILVKLAQSAGAVDAHSGHVH
jgi:RND family efflux transporter MFP subunit